MWRDHIVLCVQGLTPAFNDVVAGQVPMILRCCDRAAVHQTGRLRIPRDYRHKTHRCDPDFRRSRVGRAGYTGFLGRDDGAGGKPPGSSPA